MPGVLRVGDDELQRVLLHLLDDLVLGAVVRLPVVHVKVASAAGRLKFRFEIPVLLNTQLRQAEFHGPRDPPPRGLQVSTDDGVFHDGAPPVQQGEGRRGATENQNKGYPTLSHGAGLLGCFF